MYLAWLAPVTLKLAKLKRIAAWEEVLKMWAFE